MGLAFFVSLRFFEGPAFFVGRGFPRGITLRTRTALLCRYAE